VILVRISSFFRRGGRLHPQTWIEAGRRDGRIHSNSKQEDILCLVRDDKSSMT